MPLVSSPTAYPPSSSPAPIPESRKRTSTEEPPVQAKRRLVGLSDKTILADLNAYKINIRNTISEQSDGKPKFVSHRIYGPFIEDDEDQDPAFLAELEDTAKVCLKISTLGLPKMRGPFIEDEDETEKTTLDMIHKLAKAPAEIANLPNLNLSAAKYRQPCGLVTVSGPLDLRTSSGKSFKVKEKSTSSMPSYEQLIAARSSTVTGRATKSFYGINIHDLVEKVSKVTPSTEVPSGLGYDKVTRPSIERPDTSKGETIRRTMLWTEKYRARKFTDLVGDERTHRSVLRWLKGWDPIVFPGSCKAKPKHKFSEDGEEAYAHRKILLLTGPPGLGKTTLAHVCARQAGYEVVEINASDERNRDVVKGRIKDSVGTENVKGIKIKSGDGTVRKAGKPVCVVVDEVDGVVGGGAGGEGGFIKALIDLVALDQKNTAALGMGVISARAKRGDRFRLLRPMILICNDIYHPSLRPLRSSSIAEIIHIRRPPLDKVVARLKMIFEKEGVHCDGDGVRRLCEATWGITSKRESQSVSSSTGEGDIRGILVVGEWAATKMRVNLASSTLKTTRLTKKWVEDHMLHGMCDGGGADRVLGRGGTKEVVQRVFIESAGFPKHETRPIYEEPYQQIKQSTKGVSELVKCKAMQKLRHVIDACGETDRIVTDCFASYPSHSFQDDMFLTKPNVAYDWLHFHDSLSTRIFSGQEWELSPYLSEAVLGFHYLFASSPQNQYSSGDQKRWDEEQGDEPIPFSGPRADYEASEAQKQNKTILSGLRSSLSIPLFRAFRSPEEICYEFLPSLIKILTPNVKPVVVGGSGDQRGIVSVRRESERAMIQRAVSVMSAVGVTFEKGRIEGSQRHGDNYIYRMEP